MMANFWHREKTTCAVLLTLTGTLWILPIVRMETCNPSVKVRPVVSITSSPKNNRLRIGASMNLTCTAQPRDADSVHLDRWVDYIEWHDPQGRRVGAICRQPSDANSHKQKLSCPLLLKKLTVDSLGFYTCQAGNGYTKHCTRKSVRITARPKVNISGASNLIIEGNSVNLTCEIVAGWPEPEITWFKCKTLLRESWSLLFPKIKKSDEGQYTCRAENDAGNDTKHVNISVKVPPRIKLEFKNVNIELHSAFSTKCNWSGDPEVHVNWTKDGVLLSTNSTLVIRRATFKDKGNYECTAQNDYGKANASIWIDVTAEQVPRAIQGSNSLWYYIGGLVAVVIVVSLIACFFCKRRRTVLIKSRQFKERTIQMEPLNVEVNEWEIEMSRVEGPSEPCGELF